MGKVASTGVWSAPKVGCSAIVQTPVKGLFLPLDALSGATIPAYGGTMTVPWVSAKRSVRIGAASSPWNSAMDQADEHATTVLSILKTSDASQEMSLWARGSLA